MFISEKITLVLFLFIFFIRNVKTVMSTLENTTTAIVHEAINEEYEYIQYNKQLRLIRSVKDDMYQMQSILTACFAPDTKLPKDWFRNQSTIELLS